MSATGQPPLSHSDYAVACICPLGIELTPVLALLDTTHELLPLKRDQNAYTLGSIGQHNVVVAVLPEIGNNAASSTITKLLDDFPAVRFALLVGIGGGVPGEEEETDIRLGDVVVSQPTNGFGGVVQYDLGKKLSDGKYERTGHLDKPPIVLNANVRKLQALHRMSGSQMSSILSDMVQKYPKLRPEYSFPVSESDHLFKSFYHHTGGANCERCSLEFLVPRTPRHDREPRIHYGTIGSANVVIKDPDVRDALQKDMNVLCVEMEAAGILNSLPCLVIRGICDYADSHKNKRWQSYASAVAAAYMKELLTLIPAQQVSQMQAAKLTIQTKDQQGHNYGDFNVGGNASMHVGDVHHHYAATSSLEISEDMVRSPTASEKQFLDFIGPRQFFDIRERVEGTCSWSSQTSQFRSWLHATQSSVLWITGGAGTGKTTMTNYLVELLRGQHSPFGLSSGSVVCAFFCSRDIHGRHDINSVLQNLVLQLTESRTKIVRRIKGMFGSTKRDYSMSFEAAWRMFENVLDMLPFQCVYIVIDALDECDVDLKMQLLPKLLRILGSKTATPAQNVKSVKLMLSGQPRIHNLLSAPSRTIDHHHIDVDSQSLGSQQDISLYIRTRVKELINEGFCSEVDAERLVGKLQTLAENSFLWLEVVTNHLRGSLRYRSDDFDTLLSTLPRTMQQTYARYLPPILDSEIPVLRRHLHLLVAMSRPLRVKEIHSLEFLMEHATESLPSWTLGEAMVVRRTIERALGPLVRFSDSTVQFIHTTAKDFFVLLEQKQGHPLYDSHAVNIMEAHLSCANACMIYLLHEDIPLNIFDMEALSSPSLTDSPVSVRHDLTKDDENDFFSNIFDLEEVLFMRDADSQDRDVCTAIQQRFHAYDYAAKNWMFHLSQCRGVAPPETLIMGTRLLSHGTDETSNWYRYYVNQSHHAMPSRQDAIPLVLAALFDLTALLEALLQKPNFQMTPQTLFHALFWAAARGSSRAVRILLDFGVPASKSDSELVPLGTAAKGNFLEICDLLLQCPGIDLNELDAQGRSPLSLAAEANHTHVLQSLLKHKFIDVNKADADGKTPLATACAAGSVESVQIFKVDGRANVAHSDLQGRVAFHHASHGGHLEVLKKLFGFPGLDIHTRDHKGRNAISLGAQKGHHSIIKWLLAKRVDATCEDHEGRNTISWIANNVRSSEGEATLEYLLRKAPAAADAPDKNGWSPLAWALDTPGYTRAVQLLLRTPGIDVNRCDQTFGRCILSWATSSGMSEIVDCLLRTADINVNSRCSNGRTPLSYAAAVGKTNIVERLLQVENLDPWLLDDKGRSPTDWALLNNNAGIANLLHSHVQM